MFTCPTCGSPDCIQPAEEVLAASASLYAPCRGCVATQPLDKLTSFADMELDLSRDTGRCRSCGKRHIDYVMAETLGILVGEGLKSGMTALKDVGSPLIVYGVELQSPPRLGARQLVLVLDDVDRRAAARIVDEVPEVKGVLRRTGGPRKSVGLMDVSVKPHVYELLAGCDVRADVVSSLVGDMVFYRNQGQMHIEFWRNHSLKIKMLEKMFLEGELQDRIVVDGLASAGTLGLLAAASGAKKVILNDAWRPAVQSILVNIEVNRRTLGVELEPVAPVDQLPVIGDAPTLVARAAGDVEIEVYHSDFRRLAEVVHACDVCIIDPFPGVSPDDFTRRWKDIVREKIVIL